jgi:hypothetical protein
MNFNKKKEVSYDSSLLSWTQTETHQNWNDGMIELLIKITKQKRHGNLKY